MTTAVRQLAAVSGASTGIGVELARCCAGEHYVRIVVADEPAIETAAEEIRTLDANVRAGQTDLASFAAVDPLLEVIGRRTRDRGKRPSTGSIAGFMPGPDQAVYNASKAFLDSFSYALRHALQDCGVTVTCLMPGATETEFFRRADVLDTKVGRQRKDNPERVARDGFEAMQRGSSGIVSGWNNTLQAAIAHLTPAATVAEIHRVTAASRAARKLTR